MQQENIALILKIPCIRRIKGSRGALSQLCERACALLGRQSAAPPFLSIRLPSTRRILAATLARQSRLARLFWPCSHGSEAQEQGEVQHTECVRWSCGRWRRHGAQAERLEAVVDAGLSGAQRALQLLKKAARPSAESHPLATHCSPPQIAAATSTKKPESRFGLLGVRAIRSEKSGAALAMRRRQSHPRWNPT